MSVLPPPLSPPDGAPPAGPEDDGPAWPAWSAFAALFGALTATLLASSLAIGVLSALGVDVRHPNHGGVAILLTYVQDIAFVGAACLTALLITGRLRARDFGVRIPRLALSLRWAGGAAVGYLAFFLTFQAAVHPNSGESIFEQLGIDRGSPSVVALAALVCVVAPLAEEILFRGYMWAALRRGAGPWGATIIVGALFGAVHGFGTPALLLIPLAVLGALLCLVRWRTGSIMPTVALHALNNCAAFAGLEGWTWQAVPLTVVALALALAVLRLLTDVADPPVP